MSTSIDGIYFNITNNTPIVGVSVTAQSVDGYSEGSATTDSNGRFTITGLTDKFWLAKATTQVDELGVFYLIPNPTFHRDLSSISADQHHAGFIGLLDSASNIVGVDSNAYITITDDGVINADAAGAEGGTLALTIDQFQIDHGSIDGIADDDHSRYADRGGRTGGQEIYGGLATGEDLLLRGNSFGIDGSVFIGSSTGHFEFVESTGQLKFIQSGSSAGILMGGDTLWYRSAANTWKTPDHVEIDSNLTVAGQVKLPTTGSAAGILIGADAQWYRSAADVMRTPDAVTVDGVLTVGSQNVATPDRSIVCLAAGGYPTTTGGCSDVTKVQAASNDDYKVLDFNKDADEFAIFGPFAIPKNYDASTFVCQGIHWTTEGGASAETVRWAISMKILANDNADTVAYGTAINVDDTWLANGDIHLSGASSAITPGGTAAGGGLLYIRFMRDISGDDLGGDARFISALFTYGTDAISD